MKLERVGWLHTAILNFVIEHINPGDLVYILSGFMVKYRSTEMKYGIKIPSLKDTYVINIKLSKGEGKWTSISGS
jgi:hypothetical protein